MEKVSVVDKVYELEDLHDLRLALVQVLCDKREVRCEV